MILVKQQKRGIPALGFPKIEMKKILVISLISVLLVSLSLLVYASNSWSKDQKIEAIQVIGNDILSEKEVLDLTDSLCYSGVFGKEELIRIKGKVLKSTFVKNANVYTNSGKLVINIEEREPLAYFISSGKVKLLSEDLELMQMRKDLKKYDLPVVRVKNGDFSKAKQALNKLFGFIQDNENMNLLLSEIVYNKSTEEFDLILNQNSIVVKLGRKKYLEKKFKKFNEFWYKVALKEGINFKTIDLRWEKKILVS